MEICGILYILVSNIIKKYASIITDDFNVGDGLSVPNLTLTHKHTGAEATPLRYNTNFV